ncbi:MAG: zinc-ribbon and DUF3426 domain-containing protein, partial [Gammaproteobacteria bacterium]
MLTQCPNCRAVFRLHAASLSAAHGFVTCGACEVIFNALNRLADEAADPPASSPIAAVDFETPTSTAALPVVLKTPASSPALTAALPIVLQGSKQPVVAPLVEPVPQPASVSSSIDIESVPAVLREDVERLLKRQRAGTRWLWLVLALCAALALLLQVAWTERGWVFAHYAPARAYASVLCETCRWDPPRGIEGVELIARDVREHPQYAHALLVNATLANRGARAAGYPVIELSIYDRSGGVVGIRRFPPAEYLDQSIDIEAGMPVGRKLYV